MTVEIVPAKRKLGHKMKQMENRKAQAMMPNTMHRISRLAIPSPKENCDRKSAAKAEMSVNAPKVKGKNLCDTSTRREAEIIIATDKTLHFNADPLNA